MKFPVSNLKDIIIQPFPIHFDRNDYHVILFLKNHPEYEAIEAMIRKNENNKNPYIRAIITHLDKSQVDFINDKNIVEIIKNRRIKREIHYTPIYYEQSQKSGKQHILIKFTSHRKESINFDFYTAGRPSSKYCKLIDPLGHSKDISLPAMYPEKTSLAGSKSKVVINGVEYKPPVKKWIPLIFKGMEGYYSEIFNIGVLRAGTEQIKIIESPSEVKRGQKWVLKTGNETKTYEITDIKGDNITVNGKNECIKADLVNEKVRINEISCLSSSKNGRTSIFLLKFIPSISVSFNKNSVEYSKANFSISIDEHSDLITGVVDSKVDKNLISLTLRPHQPLWAVKRPFSTQIKMQDDSHIINSEILANFET